MRSGFDVNRINGDGYLILPLSMSRLANSQDPEWCYEILKLFLGKLEIYSCDAVLLYTNGLYFNSMEVSFENRKKTNQQVINHNAELRNLVESRKEFIPNAIHYLPVDYVILNTPQFHTFFAALKKLETEDEKFRAFLAKDSNGREYNEANVNFLLEEIVIAHILREKLVQLPRTLVRNDMWRLIAYAGVYLYADAYQWQRDVLPRGDGSNPFSGTQYDTDQKKLFVFDEENLPS